MDTPYLAEFRKALEGWVDERFLSRDNVWALSMFHLYLVNLSEADGWAYYGHSWKEGSPMGCLVVKADIDEIPHVVFTSARDSMGGIRAFIRKMEAGVLEWRPDRYRG